ncbi:MAG: CvpA family protein [Magnetococcales bacterium]|nr:CvpA family protein [Magnetococcales bacterium]
MTLFDYMLILIVGLSTVTAWVRGFLPEVINLLAWVVGALVTMWLAPSLEVWLTTQMESPILPSVVAYSLVFVSTFGLIITLGTLLTLWVRPGPLTVPNRLLGMMSGGLRGILLLFLGFGGLLAAGVAFPNLMLKSVLAPQCVIGARQLVAIQTESSTLADRIHQGYQRFQRAKAGQKGEEVAMRLLVPAAHGSGLTVMAEGRILADNRTQLAKKVDTTDAYQLQRLMEELHTEFDK